MTNSESHPDLFGDPAIDRKKKKHPRKKKVGVIRSSNTYTEKLGVYSLAEKLVSSGMITAIPDIDIGVDLLAYPNSQFKDCITFQVKTITHCKEYTDVPILNVTIKDHLVDTKIIDYFVFKLGFPDELHRINPHTRWWTFIFSHDEIRHLVLEKKCGTYKSKQFSLAFNYNIKEKKLYLNQTREKGGGKSNKIPVEKYCDQTDKSLWDRFLISINSNPL